MKILVIGSFMTDLVVRTPRVRHNGETIIGTHFFRCPGGKGANQAVAVARLGADVTMIGKLGKDTFGEEFLEIMEQENINSSFILKDTNFSTGVGILILDQDNKIKTLKSLEKQVPDYLVMLINKFI